MCGIVGYIGNKKAVPVLIKGLKALEYRGYDSAGVATIELKKKDERTIKIVKESGRVADLESALKKTTNDGAVGIAHTRWATHGMPNKTNAHPHYDNSEKIAVVHNGIIENYIEIKKKLEKKGYKLKSETDTEVIPNLISMYYKKDLLKAVRDAVAELEGSYAIEVLSVDNPDEIIVAKKDSPMVIGKGEGENFVASDIPAVLKYTSNFYFMEDKEIAVIKQDQIKFYDMNLKEVKKKIKNIEWDAESSDKAGYADYMLKEINEQPQAILETIGTSLPKNKKVNLPLDKVNFNKFNKIFIVACGTAMHAGLAAKYTFEKYTKIPVTVDMASEFRYREPLIDKKTLCIYISQSGETADTIAALKLSKEMGATTIAIVNVIGSSITRLADYTLYTHAGPEIAVASTKAYTCQVVLLNIFALYIAERLKETNAKFELNTKEVKALKEEILDIPNKIKEALKLDKKVKALAKKVYKNKDVFFIGRGVDAESAKEASLKLKEISYIHSESYPSGELKHGPIALIEKGTFVVGIATSDTTAAKTLSNLEEVLARGAEVLIVTNKKLDISKMNYIIEVPEVSHALSSAVDIVPLQLLSYYIAKEKKLDVDKPRNLAKSVTVE